MAVKLIMSWDIAPDKEQEYFEFVVSEFIPGVQRLGFELSDAWATVYGTQPQIMVGVKADSRPVALRILRSREWISLNNQLQDFVKNFTLKLIESRAGFQF